MWNHSLFCCYAIFENIRSRITVFFPCFMKGFRWYKIESIYFSKSEVLIFFAYAVISIELNLMNKLDYYLDKIRISLLILIC